MRWLNQASKQLLIGVYDEHLLANQPVYSGAPSTLVLLAGNLWRNVFDGMMH